MKMKTKKKPILTCERSARIILAITIGVQNLSENSSPITSGGMICGKGEIGDVIEGGVLYVYINRATRLYSGVF